MPTESSCNWSLLRILVAFKVGYFSLALGIVLLWPNMDVNMFFAAMQRWPREGEPTFGSHFATWDAAHYLYLSEVGYTARAGSCAFYPLWPILMRVGTVLTGGNHLLSGLLLVNALSLAALFLFHRVVRSNLGNTTANRALVFLLSFPGALFLQFPYSEALFFALLMWLWSELNEQRYLWAAVAAFFLPLTRAVGVLCAVPLLFHLVTRRRPAADYVILIGLLAGCGFYFLLMGVWTGNPFEGFEAQKRWPVNSVWNILNIPKFFEEFVTPQDLHIYHGSMLDRIVFLCLASCLPIIYRLDREWFVWTLVLGVLPAMISSFVSFTRYVVMAVPLFVAIANVLEEPRLRWYRWGVVALFGVTHLVLLIRHLNFRWAG